MGLIADVLAVLRRPLEPSTGLGSIGKRKGAPAGEPPVTEAELWEAIHRCADERATAERIIASRGERREVLLMQDGSDGEIAALDTEVASANLTLERIERIEPDLYRRIGELREIDTRARWVGVRDLYAEACRKYAEAVRVFQPAVAEMQAAFDGASAEFPSAPLPTMMPGFPATIDYFDRQIAQLTQTVFDSKRSLPRTMRSVEEIMRADGAEAAEQLGSIVPTGAETISVRMLKEIRPSDDPATWLRAGRIKRVPPAEARELILAGEGESVGANTPGKKYSIR